MGGEAGGEAGAERSWGKRETGGWEKLGGGERSWGGGGGLVK